MGISHKMIVSTDELRAMIPQKHPMVMIDGLLFSDASSTKTCLTIREDNIFFSGGFFREPGLIENIAQTAASGAGYQSILNNEEISLGYIASVQNLTIYRLPEIGSDLITTVDLKNKVFDITVLQGKIYQDEALIAACDMKVFQQTKQD
ncbi:3-hydroxyacyl-ACP dehydratase [bacterium]|nr:3-hydroxyacyl-ACP dehydratase [bacterium]